MPEGPDKEMAKKGHGQASGTCGHRIRGCRCPSKAHDISLTLDIPCEDCAPTEKSAAWWHPKKPREAAKPDPTALKYLPTNLKDLLNVTFGSKWATKEEHQRKAR